MTQAFGTWKSPLTAGAIASGTSLRDVQWDSDGETLVWQESRGKTGALVVQRPGDAPRDLTDRNLNVAGRVGYGGGAFTVGGGNVYFCAGDRLYRQALSGGTPKAITPGYGGCASPALSADGKWLAYVHTYEGVDGLALVDAAGAHFPRKLAYGTDFVMQPAWHPDGSQLAYIAWNHPQMPWNGSELRLLRLGSDKSGMPVAEDNIRIAGDRDTAIFQPQFSPDGKRLAYISDATGWGQIYIYDLEADTHRQVTTRPAEHGTPAWAQGMRLYGFSGDGASILYLENDRGFFSLRRHVLETGVDEPIHNLDDYTHFEQLSLSPKCESVAMLASSSQIPPRVISLSIGSRPLVRRRSQSENLPPDQLSPARAITWRGDDGETVHGLFYAPSPRDDMPAGRPPLIVNVHGGPTSQRAAAYASETQFFTTRGYAVLQVNHRGSTGYGKAYMEKHRGSWGVYDVIDCISGVKHLAETGVVDADRAVVMGGSAGGFTVLQSLVDYPGFYKAGICAYGVSNQFGLLMDTHKFESRYLDWLLGELPEAADLFRQRSPLFHADNIVDPLILFQGTDDVVVPQDQSDSIVASLQRRGVAHEYHLFKGEGHGWRKPETIESFYQKIERFLLQHVIYA